MLPATISPSTSSELERLLAATRAALVRQVFAYGIGTVLGATSLWLLFAFLADWALRVPHAIRVFHGLSLLIVVGVFLWRDLLRPLKRVPDREGLALLHERAHPELANVLISAVQFERGAGQGDRAMMAAVIEAAEMRAAALDPRAVLDPEAPRARLLLGCGGVVGLSVLAGLSPGLASTFLERLLGGSAPWPQRTHLVLELPGIDASHVISHEGEVWRVRLARGSDLALLVTAEGETPSDVRLRFEGGRTLDLSPSGGNAFRTLLQSCGEDTRFAVYGGDDEDGLPRVELEVLEPPDVEGLALFVTPPAYSGQAPATYFNQDVEVLRGSQIRVHVLAAPRAAQGVVRFLPDDVTQPLTSAPYPAKDEGSTGEAGLTFICTAEKTFGFRIELVDENGLANPEPGLTRIRVLEDRAPELTVLAPARSELETVRGAALPLRLRAEDDFALRSLGWRVRAGEGSTESVALAEQEFTPQRVEASANAPRSKRAARDTAFGSGRFELDSLARQADGTTKELAIDSRFELEFFARDGCAPVANEGRSAPVRIRIVTPEELLRRLQDRLAETRMDALRLGDEQRTKRARIEELLDALVGDGPLETSESLALASALAGERRVLSEAQALARALATAAEDVLYARLDDKAAPLLEFYDRESSRGLDARFQAEPWRALARESAAGRLASEGFAATLVKLVGLALEISEDHATQCVAAINTAQDAALRAEVAQALEAAGQHAQQVEKGVEVLLAELSEWDNFQNVLTLARDILNRQKALHERTQALATQK